MITERNRGRLDPGTEARLRMENDIRMGHATSFLREHFRGELGPRTEEIERLKRSLPAWTQRVRQMLYPYIINYDRHVQILSELDFDALRKASISEAFRYRGEKMETKQNRQIEITDIVTDAQEESWTWNYDGEDTAKRVANDLRLKLSID